MSPAALRASTLSFVLHMKQLQCMKYFAYFDVFTSRTYHAEVEKLWLEKKACPKLMAVPFISTYM